MSSYNKIDLDNIAKKNGFIRDNLEKVFRLVDILGYINTNPLLLGSLALKGGTAINLIVFELPRLSVDIDLDFIIECSKEEMQNKRESINKEILYYMYSQGYELSKNTKNPHSLDSWAFNYINSGGNRDNIKIEINYSMRNHIYPLEMSLIKVGFLSSINIKALSPLELFGSKIKALIERTAARDLYDVHNMIKYNLFSNIEIESLRKVVVFYLAVGGRKKPITNYNFEAIDNLKYKDIRANLIPVLRKTENFDFVNAKIEVKDFLFDLIKLSENEIKFIEDFNRQKYSPKFLFEDDKILERIVEHPMAIWKTRKKDN